MISIIILAAGLSSRMKGGNKLLLPFKGKTILEQVVDHILMVDVGEMEVIVVLGNEADKIKQISDRKNVTFVINGRYKQGMTTSIQAGIDCTIAESKGFMICLGDMPLITVAEYRFLIQSFLLNYANNDRCITLPFFQEKKGNPVIFAAYYRSIILAHQELEGCRTIIQGHPKEVIRIVMPTSNILRDVDDRETYEQLLTKDG